MRRAYKARVALSKANLDVELVECAKRTGHHGVKNFIEMVRQRCHCAITEEYARDILARGGYPAPKP